MFPDWQALQYFHFMRPGWALLLIPWAIIIAGQIKRQDSGDMFGNIIAPHLLEHLRLQRFDSRWFNPRMLTNVIMLLSLIILMGPSWRQQPSPLSQDEAALVILLDASSSMTQRDVQPSRAQRARQKISDLLALRPDKKAALIAYAGSAHTVLSLTADQDILTQYLSAITPETMPRAGKFPEYALPQVDEVLRETAAPATIVLFTDGLGSQSEEAFEDYFDSHPHQLIVVGVGTLDTPEDLAPLERDALQQLADSVGGSYVSLTTDDKDMRRVNRRVDSHYVVVDDSALPWLDSGYPLVFPALVLFLMWFRRGWTLSWAWLLVPIILTQPVPGAMAQDETVTREESVGYPALHWFANLWMTPDQQGRALLQLGHYKAAGQAFQDPIWKGVAYYYNEDFMLAAEYFSRSDSDDALFNEANARAQARDYLRAVNRYDRLLARTPDYPGAASNRDTVQAIIDEINRMSESQQQEAGVSSEDKELSGDDAVPAQGAEEISWEKAKVVQLTAEDILQDESTRDMWLRGVQQDPSDFLAIKFNMQLQRREEPNGDQP